MFQKEIIALHVENNLENSIIGVIGVDKII